MPVNQSCQRAGQGSHQNADQNRGFDVPSAKDGDSENAEGRERSIGIAQIAQNHDSGGIRLHDARVSQANEGYEQSDSRADSRVQGGRNGSDDPLPDAHQREYQERHSGKKDRSERGFPRYSHAFDDSVRKVRVQSHARRKRDRIAGDCAHQNCGERRRKAGGGEDCCNRHARVLED